MSYGLNDSPAGLASWIIEKFYSWSDCKGSIENRFTEDELLTNIMIYWVRPVMRAFSAGVAKVASRDPYSTISPHLALLEPHPL